MDSNGSMAWYTSLYITYQAINPFVSIAIDASIINERYLIGRSSRVRWAQAFVVGGLCRLDGRTRTATLALDCVALRHCHPHQGVSTSLQLSSSSSRDSSSLADVRIDANQPSCMLLGVIAIVIAVPAITSTKRMHDGGFV